ncbi:hypothetical protein F511_14987 [Dorcoceras hygrometricum]|uniref:Uncharacterized protein n=1 Tax=Dorcoceras hygrometricum TaxID=472368 RepID=A0A2Z7BGM5_9LAMI|nr:hypothetical protein F511_14987 [Dorcoceras hygrometricum]
MFTEPLPSISTVIWSKVGGVELLSLSSFDCYQSGDLSRRVEGARRNYSAVPAAFAKTNEETDLRRLKFPFSGVAGNLAAQSGAQAGRSLFD